MCRYMETQELLAQVEALVAPVLRDHGLMLVDVEWRRAGRRGVLRFFVDKTVSGQERVSIADCQRFSEEVEYLLDASDLPLEAYDLEVSSPGLDRELKKEREFRWATGKMVRCWVSGSLDGRTEFVGHLRQITDDFLSLEEFDGQLRELPRALVTKARLDIEPLSGVGRVVAEQESE